VITSTLWKYAACIVVPVDIYTPVVLHPQKTFFPKCLRLRYGFCVILAIGLHVSYRVR